MTKIEELRAELFSRVCEGEKRLMEADIHVTATRQAYAIHAAALEAHDAAVAALTGNGAMPPLSQLNPLGFDPHASRTRRSIVSEVERELTSGVELTVGATVDRLADLIGNVRPAQIEGALDKLNKKAKAWRDHNGKWHAGPEAKAESTVARMPLAAALSQPQPPEPQDAA